MLDCPSSLGKCMKTIQTAALGRGRSQVPGHAEPPMHGSRMTYRDQLNMD